MVNKIDYNDLDDLNKADDPKAFLYDYIEPETGQKANYKSKTEYDYPVNIFKKVFYTWTRKVLKSANTYKQLEITHLGTFSPELYPDNFLKEIKKEWEDMTKRTKNSPLIKALLKGNAKRLILVFLGSLLVAVFDSINVNIYNQIVNNLEEHPEDQPMLPLLHCMILLLINYFLYTITFRSMETYTSIFSFKLISQLDALVYDKLLRISPYGNVNEGTLVNFILLNFLD